MFNIRTLDTSEGCWIRGLNVSIYMIIHHDFDDELQLNSVTFCFIVAWTNTFMAFMKTSSQLQLKLKADQLLHEADTLLSFMGIVLSLFHYLNLTYSLQKPPSNSPVCNIIIYWPKLLEASSRTDGRMD